METLKVGKNSEPKGVAGAIAAIVRQGKKTEIQAIGAGAVNQTIKAIIIARGYLSPNGINLVCIPSFADVVIDDEERTAIKFLVEAK